MNNKEMAIAISKLSFSSDDILLKLKNAGWFSKLFPAMRCVAVNPIYESFNLGISGQWIQPCPLLENTHSLWIYPCESLIDIFGLEAK